MPVILSIRLPLTFPWQPRSGNSKRRGPPRALPLLAGLTFPSTTILG